MSSKGKKFFDNVDFRATYILAVISISEIIHHFGLGIKSLFFLPSALNVNIKKFKQSQVKVVVTIMILL